MFTLLSILPYLTYTHSLTHSLLPYPGNKDIKWCNNLIKIYGITFLKGWRKNKGKDKNPTIRRILIIFISILSFFLSKFMFSIRIFFRKSSSSVYCCWGGKNKFLCFIRALWDSPLTMRRWRIFWNEGTVIKYWT